MAYVYVRKFFQSVPIASVDLRASVKITSDIRDAHCTVHNQERNSHKKPRSQLHTTDKNPVDTHIKTGQYANKNHTQLRNCISVCKPQHTHLSEEIVVRMATKKADSHLRYAFVTLFCIVSHNTGNSESTNK